MGVRFFYFFPHACGCPGFLDASLPFARDAQIHIRAPRDGSITADVHRSD